MDVELGLKIKALLLMSEWGLIILTYEKWDCEDVSNAFKEI